jgi:RNA-binding protein
MSTDPSEAQKRYLRGLGHGLKPVIQVGDAGLSDALLAEFESTLSHHELIKVRVRAPDRQERDAIVARLCETSAATLIQRIGNVALVYRHNPERHKIVLPDA